MVGLIKPVSSDTLISVFSTPTAFTTEQQGIVINSFTIDVLKGLFQPKRIYDSMKTLKIRKHMENPGHNFGSISF